MNIKKNIILNPEFTNIDSNGVKNFFWPLKNSEINNFKNKFLIFLENYMRSKRDMDFLIMHIPYIRRDITNFYIAKKFSFFLSKNKIAKKKTYNELVDKIIFKKKFNLPKDIDIILNGLRKRKRIFTKLKKIKNFFYTSNLSYIEKEKINKNHTITFSNNYLIDLQSKYLKKRINLRTSHFQDWFPSGKIKINKDNIKNKEKKLKKLILDTIKYLNNYGLNLNKNEKKYISDLFVQWFSLTDFFIKELEKSKKFLPKKMWIGTSGVFYHRIFSYLVRKSGGIIYGFDHGMSTGCVKQNAKNILELAHIDFFYTFSKYMKLAIKRNFIKNFVNKDFKKNNILSVNTKHVKFYKKKNTLIKKDNVLYVPRVFTDHNIFVGDTYLYPDIMYYDWQIKLFNSLNSLNYKINIKPHPVSRPKFPKTLLNFHKFKLFKDPFMEVIKKFDLLIFDCIQNTAFLEAMRTDTPMVFLNIKEYEIVKDVKDSIKKRCGYVDCKIKNNRVNINRNLLAAAIGNSENLRKDKSFYNFYYQ